MFLSVTQWSDQCVFWQIFLWVFLFGLLPLSCVWFAVSLNETQVWLGICGSSGLCVCVCFVWFVVICLHFRTFGVLVQMRFLLLMHVRTVKTIEGQVVSQAQKALMLLPRSEKGSSMSSEEHLPIYRTLLTKMSFFPRVRPMSHCGLNDSVLSSDAATLRPGKAL